MYRRGARRWRKLYRVNGHLFQAKRFSRVSYALLSVHNIATENPNSCNRIFEQLYYDDIDWCCRKAEICCTE